MADKDPYKYFRIEGAELLERLRGATLSLEQRPTAEAMREVLRITHTLKGAAGVVRLTEIAERAHAIEDLLQPYRDRAESSPREVIDDVLAATDAIEACLRDLAPTAEPAAAERRSEDRRSADDNRGALILQTPVEDLEALIHSLSEAAVAADGMKQTGQGLRELREAAGKARDRCPAGSSAAAAAEATVALAGRLLSEHEARVGRVQRELDEAREGAQKLRLMSASSVFGELERRARDLARRSGKQVRMVTSGGGQLLEAQVLSEIRGALIHMVTNAVVHGIEEPEARRAAGKPLPGVIRLDVKRRERALRFAVTDDGRGLDLEKIRERLIGLGRREADQPLTEETALELCFENGFSTSSSANLNSGRGVGLDAIRGSISRLEGRIEARALPQGGMRFEVSVPMSMSAVKVLMVEDAGPAALPFACVRAVCSLDREQLVASGADRVSMSYGEQAIPFCPLAELLERSCEARRRWVAIVIQSGERLVGLGVERLGKVRLLSVRPLPAVVGRAPLVSGAGFDVEGRPLLLLEPVALAEAIAEGARPSLLSPPPPPSPILVIDDSLTTRMLEKTILEAKGYEVGLASSAEQGLEMARAGRYALFLVDVEMPGMNGFEFVEQVGADPALKDIPAVLMTTRKAPEDIQRGLEAGARAYLIKSEFDDAALLSTIRSLIG